MKKLSMYLVLIVLILMLSYFALSYLQTRGNLFFGIAIAWTLLLPVLASVPYGFKYIICLPSPIFGTWLLILPLIEKYFTLSIFSTSLMLAVSFFLVIFLHISTRERVMFWKIPLVSLSRGSIAAVSVMFFALGIMLVNPSLFSMDMPTELFFFSTTLLGYIASSMLYINSSYRMFVLSDRLEILNLDDEMSEVWTKIRTRYPNVPKDLDLLQYYFNESLRCFLEGDFEKSLVWGYKVIREKTIVNPTEYIDDKRVGKPSFGDVRNTLMHPKREKQVDASKIRTMLKNLFNDCLDLLEREFVFIKKVSEAI